MSPRETLRAWLPMLTVTGALNSPSPAPNTTATALLAPLVVAISTYPSPSISPVAMPCATSGLPIETACPAANVIGAAADAPGTAMPKNTTPHPTDKAQVRAALTIAPISHLPRSEAPSSAAAHPRSLSILVRLAGGPRGYTKFATATLRVTPVRGGRRIELGG